MAGGGPTRGPRQQISPTERRCGRCQDIKHVDCFYSNKSRAGRSDPYDTYCIPCRKIVHKEWRDRTGLYAHIRRYGLTAEDFNKMLADQEGACAICGGPPTAPRRLAVDHCHATNTVRGLLCDSCNRGLGQFKDDIVVMQKALDYLRNSLP